MSKFIVTRMPPEETGGFIDSFTDDDEHFSEPYNDAIEAGGHHVWLHSHHVLPELDRPARADGAFIFNAEN